MSSNPRRTPVTRPESGVVLSLKTNMVLRKGATFHSPTTPPSSPEVNFKPPSLPRRSQTNLDDVIDSHRRRVALTLGNIDRSLSASSGASSPSSTKTFRDDSLPIPRGVLDHTLDNALGITLGSSIMSKEPEVERRVLRPRSHRPSRYHESDSGLGTSIASTNEKRADAPIKKEKSTTKAFAVTRSVAGRSASNSLPALSARATNRICEHTLKPLLAEPAFKDFHPLVLECPRKIQEKDIVCLRDVEKTLLLVAPERTKVDGLYLDFCLTTIRCIQATVEYLSDREQIRPRDLPYTSGYFIDLVDQLRQYAQQLADAREKGGEADEMDVDPTDEIKLHGGIHINGRPAELVRVKRNGKAISMATGEPVDGLEEEAQGPVRIKRSASEELEDKEDIMRSMARRKKNASPEELAPKKCREPGCTKEFKRPCDLTKHEKTHSRPWKCPVPTCKYHEFGWPTEKEMDRHHNDKHSSAPPMYECLYKPCPYKSKRESNCKQHMEKAHGWTYVRTKTNGKKGGLSSIAGSVAQPTPQLLNMPTPSSDASLGASTPPDDHFPSLYSGLDFPAYIPNDAHFDMIPQEIQIDFSPIENGTPSTDSSVDHNSAYQDVGNDFTLYEDIYSANVRLPTPVYHKELPQQYGAFTTAELCQPQPAPHISPIGQGNAMLFTPTSLADVDEGFDDHQDYSCMNNGNSGSDFLLFPPGDVSKTMFNDSALFAEIPSLAAGYSQPSSQDFLNALSSMEWASAEYNHHHQYM